MAGYLNIETLKNALLEVNDFLKQLEVANKDEKEAQTMYERMTQLPIKLDRVDSVFKAMNMKIVGIRKDEGRHEHEFREMARQTQDAKKRIEAQIKRLQDEELKKSLLVKEQHRRYGR